jgi:hypothetical protein
VTPADNAIVIARIFILLFLQLMANIMRALVGDTKDNYP